MTRTTGFLRISLLLLVVLVATGCGRWFNKTDELETLPVEAMYEEGKRSLERGNLGRAQRYFERLVARFPYGPYTEQAQLELAYAQFKNNKYDDATSTINRFIRTYPAHQHIDYAYYLKGLINFRREASFLANTMRLDLTLRDQGSHRQSFNDFAELIRRFPNSRYNADARQRMVYLRNQLARHELNVGLYYLRRDANVAAVTRAQFIIENYPQSGHQADAIALMGEAYERLGEDRLAEDARRVLVLNDPDHPWLSGNWPKERNLWRQLNPFAGER
jgi:outer membrane protein assembly factor BamD